ncbi:CTP synthetase [archaeon]|nr:CTP synthetase [archaeon]|tara:strand:- start:3487 stop:5085 length:1599 start_codon:yes stop_codon:yes gene_type:complete
MHKKFIVVTGGVLSGLGKGIAAASIGLLLQQYKVIPIKCDGYLNVDPGTMNPIEHGEVFVLDDGGEVDMDFGHYERFLNVDCKSDWSLTMGKIYRDIIEKERKGDFLGKNVQLIPDVTDLIQDKWVEIAEKENANVTLIEIGGTIGDIENELFVEAARQLKKRVGEENIIYIHLTYVPKPFGTDEQKSKPTQQSINLLREKGIFPDVIIGRCSEVLDNKIKEKISVYCDVDKGAVITGLDVNSVYKIPIRFNEENLCNIISSKLNINVNLNSEYDKWVNLTENLEKQECKVKIAICGKYTKLKDSYASIVEALNHCGAHLNCSVGVDFIDSDGLKDVSMIKDYGAVIIPGGFGKRGIDGKINVIKYCRENNIPLLGICYGMQLSIIEYARNLCGLGDANSTEIDENTNNPVIDLMPGQRNVQGKGATMRLGSYPAILKKESLMEGIYKLDNVSERHRHRYEVNPKFHSILQEKGLIFSGMSPDKTLVEFIELKDHDYFVGCQGHPELKSSLMKPAPLFYGLVKKALERNGKT